MSVKKALNRAEVKDILDILLDIAEAHYPKYSSSDDIMYINDWYRDNIAD